MRRISSSDDGYVTGDLSSFPSSLDDRESLYEVRNNAETKLRSGLSYNAKQVVVESTAGFPDKGLVRVGPPPGRPGDAELIYYGMKTESVFKDLTRGFAGSKQNQWPSGSWATNAVTAEPHNAVKDALINMQTRIGLRSEPASGTLNRRLMEMELRYLSPKPLFRAYPKACKPGEPIRFQSLCDGEVIRYMWDFGDGGTDVEQNPIYSYSNEGTYTVKLHIITAGGAQGISTKSNYITVSDAEQIPFFYVSLVSGRTYRFVDQTDGAVKQRFWVFGDGQNFVEADPNKHEHTHTYSDSGRYKPSLLVAFADASVKRIFLEEEVRVL